MELASHQNGRLSGGGARNDCESITCDLYPEVEQALTWLTQFGQARMTGTGASVFADLQRNQSECRVVSTAGAGRGCGPRPNC